jgi:aryl-alcohol dehydrogenase-like predicted oxidoreductase
LCGLYGDSEELIGKWLKGTGKRDEIFIATKFGFLKGTGFRGFDSSAAYCKQACEASLKALGIEYIDLCE